MGAQVISQKPFDLSRNHTTYGKRADGGENITLSISSSDHVHTAEKVDLIVIDRDGKAIADTKADGEAKMKKIAELSLMHRRRDETANAILNSYRSALEDRKNYFVHLYEIIDALVKKFGTDKAVRDSLGISRNKLRRLHYLANEAPLEESRHRGYHHSELRKATHDELEDGTNIAQDLIISYLEYLDQNDSSS
jgi:hypothetical protein